MDSKWTIFMVLMVSLTLFAVGESLTCCGTGETNASVKTDKCVVSQQTNSTSNNQNCTYCRMKKTEWGGTWTIERTCVSDANKDTSKCTVEDIPIINIKTTNCYCNTDLCNGVSHLLSSAVMILTSLILTKSVIWW